MKKILFFALTVLFLLGGSLLFANESRAYVEPTVILTGLNDPRDLVINDVGDIFYVDYEIGNLAVLRNGAVNPVSLLFDLNRPAGLAFDSAGNLYYTERGAGTLKRITGTTLSDNNAIIPSEITTILTGLENPADVTVYPAAPDRVYFVENAKPGTIKYYDTETKTVTTVLTNLDYPWSLAVASDGTLVFSELGKDRAGYLPPGETVPQYLKTYGPIYGLSFDQSDNIFFTLGIGATNFGILGEVFSGGTGGTGIYATEGNMRVPDVYQDYIYWGEQAAKPNGRILKIPIPETSYAQIVDGTTGAVIETDFGDTITIPAGAFDTTETITVDIGAIPESLDPTAAIIPRTYVFGPSGLTFDPPISLSFHYTEADLKDHNDSELKVYYYDTVLQDWVLVGGTVDEVAHTLTVSVDHFSTYGVFVEGTEGEMGSPEVPPVKKYSVEWLPPLTHAKITPGQTLPVSFALKDLQGNFVKNSSVKVRIYDEQGNSTEWFDAEKKAQGAPYVRILENFYHFLFQTKDYPWMSGGKLYSLEVRFDDISPFTLKFPVKKKHTFNPTGLGLLTSGFGGLTGGFLIGHLAARRNKGR